MNDPELSIVIAAVNGADVLKRTLASIDRLPERKRIEVVLVGIGETDFLEYAENSAGPFLTIPGGNASAGIPQLRYRGILAASASIIAILEDHVEVASDWATAVLDAMSNRMIAAVGGRVEPGQSGWINAGIFLADYSRYIGPVPEGDHHDLPGNNVAYRRDPLLEHAEALAEGKWESWVNQSLHASGHRLVSTNRMVVSHIKKFTLTEFLNLRWHFGRSYAGMRLDRLSTFSRTIHCLGSGILPVLLTIRASKIIAKRDVPLATQVKSWPVIALVMTVGAAGEFAGYLFGPGRSLERVR